MTPDADATGPEPQAVIADADGCGDLPGRVVHPDDESAGHGARAVRGPGRPAPRGRVPRPGRAAELCDRLRCRGRGTGWPGRARTRARPAGLHPFSEIKAGSRHAVATPGDVLFHIRATRMDLCFELATQIMGRLDGAVTVVDEVHGFRYFDERDLLGFVDGTENPVGAAAARAALIGAEDPAVRRRQLRDRAEVPARPGGLERAAGRAAGEHHRAGEAVRRRAERRREAFLRAQRADHHHGRRRGSADRPGQHAVRLGRRRAVRHLLHRLRALPRHDRADAGEHVRRFPRGKLRPAA